MEDSEPSSERPRKQGSDKGEVPDTTANASLPNGSASSELDNILRCSELGGSDEDEVNAFILEHDIDPNTSNTAKFLLTREVLHTNLAGVDPATQAKLQALLEAAGIGDLTDADRRLLGDPGVTMQSYPSSVGSALNEAAAALTRMRSDSNVNQIMIDRTLAEACSDGDVGAVRKLLSEGRSVNETTEEGESLLSLACSAGYYELAEVLLAMKANVEDRGVKGDLTPLMEAATRGHTDIVRLLLAHGADPNALSNIGSTPLHCAAGGGHEDIIRLLIEAGAAVEDQNENGHTPLMEAASAGHVGVARLLLRCGAGINTHSSEFKESALTLACYKGHLEMAKFLLEAGADQEHKTDEMHTALMEASMDGHVEVARLLLDSGAQVNMPADSFESPLTLAACGGHVELANLLIERGANLEEVNDEGYTPLMEAAREGHEEMVALLLAHGAYINGQTEETQETALTLACCGGFLEVADFLIKAGADIELGCSTPLMEASQEGHFDLVRHLVNAGANIHAQTGNGDTALTYACENGHTDIAELLIMAGADMEHESEGGRTPMMKAARAGHLSTVQYLISRGGDVNRATSTNDHTVLSLACAGGHLAVVELLLSHGADPSQKLKDGSTMLIEASRGGHTAVVNMLLDFPNMKTNRQQAGGLPLNLETSDLAGIGGDVNGLDQEMLTSRLEQFISKMMAQADGVDANSACSDAEEQLQHQAKKQEILNELHRVEQELRGRRTTYAVGSGAAAVQYDPPVADAATSGYNMGPAHQQWQQIMQQQQQNEQQLQQQKEFYQFKLQQQLKQQYQQKQMQLQQKQQLLEQAKGPLPLLPPSTSVSANLSAVLVPPPPPSPASPDSCSPPQPQQYHHPLGVARRPVPLHIAVQSHLQAHRVAEGNMGDLAQALQDWDSRDRDIVYPAEVKPMPTFFSQKLGGEGSFVKNENNDGTAVKEPETRTSLPVHECSKPVLPLHDSNRSAPEEAVTTQRSLARVLAALIQGQTDASVGGLGSSLYATKAIDTDNVSFWTTAMQTETNMSSNGCDEGQQVGYRAAIGRTESTVLLSEEEEDDEDDDNEEEEEEREEERRQQLEILNQLQQLNLGSSRCAEVLASVSTAMALQPVCDNSMPPQRCHSLEVANRTLPASPLPPSRSAPTSPPHTIPVVDPNAATESNHDTALTLACAGGHSELVQLLLSRNAEIEHKDKKGFTPLILAATAGHVDVVEILLEQGAEIEAQSERTKDTALSLACSGGRYEVVDVLLRRGANKEHRNVSDYTPLSLAASGGYVNIIKLLLNYGAEINSRTGSKLGISPLMLAAMNGHTAAVKILLDMGSDINAQIETNRNTALTLACFQGRNEVVSLLVDRKANIEHRAKTGLTPLMEAASGGYVEVGRVLLDKGADVNASPVPSSRDTALTIAADKGHYRFVELLLSLGAAVDVKNKKGNSPLWLASNGGHLDVVQLLVGAGADIDSQDNRRVTCLMAAFRKGHLKVVKWLVRHVSQFPSDKECARYISTATDKELLKKCQQCMDVIVAAKDRQAAEANKNATSLLEEIETEKSREEKRREAAARKREKKKQKRKEKQLQQQQPQSLEKQTISVTNDGDDEEDDETDSLPPGLPAMTFEAFCASRYSQKPTPQDTLCNGIAAPDSRHHALASENKENAGLKNQTQNESSRKTAQAGEKTDAQSAVNTVRAVPSVMCSDRMGGSDIAGGDSNKKTDQLVSNHSGGSSSTVDLTDSNSAMTRRKNKKNRRQTASNNAVPSSRNADVPSLVLLQEKKSVPPLLNHVVTDAAASSRRLLDGSNTNNSSAGKSSDAGMLPYAQAMQQQGLSSAPLSRTAGLKKARVDPNMPGDEPPSSGALATVQKNSKQRRLTNEDGHGYQSEAVEKKQLSSNSPGKTAVAGKPGVSPSPKKGKREDGWKEVVRKSKKIAVPAAVAGRVLGRTALAAVRELSGASVDVDVADVSLGGDRSLTIKGSADATRHAQSLITSLIQNPEREIEDLLGKKSRTRRQLPAHSDRPDDYSIGTFSIADFIVTSSSLPTASSTNESRPKYSAAVLSGSVGTVASSSGPAGAQKQQLKNQPKAQQVAVAQTVRAAALSVSRSPATSAASQIPTAVVGPRLLARTSQDVSRQLFPSDGTKDQSANFQNLATTLASVLAVSASSVASPVSVTTVFTNSTLPKNTPAVFNGPMTGRLPPASVATGVPATGVAALPEGVPFTPFDTGLKLGNKANISFASAAAVGLDKPDPAKAPGFRPPSSGTPDSTKDLAVHASRFVQSPRPVVHTRASLPSCDDANSDLSSGFSGVPGYPLPLAAQFNSCGRTGFPVNHFYEGMHSGLKSPSVLSPRSTVARDEYTTPDQPMTLPKISSSLNPHASEFPYPTSHLISSPLSSGGYHSQAAPFSDSPYYGQSFHTVQPSAGLPGDVQHVMARGSVAPASSNAGGMLLQTMPMMVAPGYSPSRGRVVPSQGHALPPEVSASNLAGMRPSSHGSGESAQSPSPPSVTSSSSPQERAEERLPQRHVGAIGIERLQKKQQLLPNTTYGAPVAVPHASYNSATTSYGGPPLAVEKPSHMQTVSAMPVSGAAAPASSIWTAFPAMLSQDWPNAMLSGHSGHAGMPVTPLLTTLVPAVSHGYSDNLLTESPFKLVDNMPAPNCYNTFPSAVFTSPGDVINKPGWNTPATMRPMAPAASINRNVSQESDWLWHRQSTPPNS